MTRIHLQCACGWTATTEDKEFMKDMNKKHLHGQRHLDYVSAIKKDRVESGMKGLFD